MDLEKLQHQLKVELPKWSQQVQDLYQRAPQDQIYAAIGIVVFTALFFAILRLFKRKASNTVVLVGLSGTGKTFLFYQLRDGSINEGTTVTSVEPIADTFVLFSERSKKSKKQPVHVVDVPGHIRSKLDEFLHEASAVVYVVDALEFLQNWRPDTEYLYELLTKESIVKKKIPVLILCNKVDIFKTHIKGFICSRLERQIDRLRVKRWAGSEPELGVAGEFFKFSQCRNRVTLGESSGLTGEISELEAFIREHVRQWKF